MNTWVCIIGLAVLLGVLLPCVVVPAVVFVKVFVRTSKEKWNYTCQEPNNPEQVELYRQATAWADRHEANRTSLRIQHHGYSLAGEYYDFGFNRAALIIPGRMEACRYSCYFAEPYRRAGYNVLTIDNRSHGASDGRINTLGIREYQDVLAWICLLHGELKNETVVCHGICIGSATALYALTSGDCPAYVSGMVADGMYVHFGESFRNHLVERNKPAFPCYQLCMAMVGLFAGKNPRKFGPENVMERLRKPILFLHGRQDIYSVPEKTMELYARCESKKRLVWFDEGKHSFLRFHAPEKYDAAIIGFLNELAEPQA